MLFGLEKLGKWIIPIIILVILLLLWYSPTGTFSTLKGVVNKLTPTFGATEVSGGKAPVNTQQQAAIDHLKKKIIYMRDSPQENCFVNYKLGSGNLEGLPFLGTSGTKITFENDQKGMVMTVFGGTAGLQVISREVIEGVRQCAIVGEDTAKNFLRNIDSGRFIGDDYFGLGYPIIIYGSTDNHNLLQFGDTFKLFDNGYIFKAKSDPNTGKAAICFIPTGSSKLSVSPGDCEVDDGTLHFACIIEERDPLSIPDALASGSVEYCQQKGERTSYNWIEFYGEFEPAITDSIKMSRTCNFDDDRCQILGDDCEGFLELGHNDQNEGCLMFFSDYDKGSKDDDCGRLRAKPGTYLPTTEEGYLYNIDNPEDSFISGDSLNYENGKEEIFDQVTKGKFNSGFRALVCAEDKKWYECNENMLGNQINIGKRFSNYPPSDEDIILSCSRYLDDYYWHRSDGDFRDGVISGSSAGSSSTAPTINVNEPVVIGSSSPDVSSPDAGSGTENTAPQDIGPNEQ